MVGVLDTNSESGTQRGDSWTYVSSLPVGASEDIRDLVPESTSCFGPRVRITIGATSWQLRSSRQLPFCSSNALSVRPKASPQESAPS